MKTILIVVIQIALGIGLAELLGQTFRENPYSAWDYRFLYTSPDAFRNVNDFWTYRPNADIAEIAIYEDPFGRFFKEYECHYRSDDNGFVNNPDRERRQYDVLLLGDSFTFGQGGCSWTNELRAALPGLSIYNAGLQGTGPETWDAILRYLVHRGYHFKHLIMIFIPEDFFRHKSQWPEGALRCLQNISDCQGRFFYPLVPGLDLIKTSAERAMDRGYSFRDRLGYFAQRYFWVSYFLQERVRDILTGNRQWHEITPRIGAALDHMAAGPQTLHLVRVVQKDEEGLRTDNAASALVKKYLSGRELPFAVCRLGYDGYLSYDGHPNSRGYARLATCVAAVIRGLDIHGG